MQMACCNSCAEKTGKLGELDPVSLLATGAKLLTGGGGGGGGSGAAGGGMLPNITVSPAINTQVSPQISPVFQQQWQPSNSPANAGTSQYLPTNQVQQLPSNLGLTPGSSPFPDAQSAANFPVPSSLLNGSTDSLAPLNTSGSGTVLGMRTGYAALLGAGLFTVILIARKKKTGR